MSEIVEAARKYIDVPFRHQGRSASGLDCVGLLVVVAQDLGIEVSDITNYRRSPDEAKFMQAIRDNLDPVRVADRQPGDIIIVRQRIFRMHCGISAEREGLETLIHATARWRRVIEQNMTGIDITNVFRFRGV